MSRLRLGVAITFLLLKSYVKLAKARLTEGALVVRLESPALPKRVH